jgi:hypothetical protein
MLEEGARKAKEIAAANMKAIKQVVGLFWNEQKQKKEKWMNTTTRGENYKWRTKFQ